MPLRARTLLGPGPSNPYPEATVALGQPLLGHLDPVVPETAMVVSALRARRTTAAVGAGSAS
jgi:aspartate aminotransferase-like enzyme